MIWADTQSKSFRDLVRPRLLKLGIPYACSNNFPASIKPEDVCLAFGTNRLKELQAMGLCHKNRAVGSMRGKVILTKDSGRVMVTWDATLPFIDYGKRPELMWDIDLAVRLHDTNTLQPKTGKYLRVNDFTKPIALLKERIEKTNRGEVAVDLETVGTDWINPEAWIVAITITVTAGYSYVVYFNPDDKGAPLTPLLKEQIEWLMSGNERLFVDGANFKFDMLWMMEKWGIKDFRNFRFDTTLTGNLMQENRSNSLNLHTKVYTEMGGYDDPFDSLYDKSKMHLVPEDDLIQYAGGDSDATLRVASKIRPALMKRKRLARFYTRLLHPAQNAVRKMEHRGMCVDVERYKELDEELSASLEDCTDRMLALIPAKLKHKHYKDLRPNRPIIVRDFLFSKQGLNLTPKMLTPKDEKPSTSGAHFEMFADHKKAGPFIAAFLEYSRAKKAKSTYVEGFMKHLRSDGRFHPSYMLFRGLFHGDNKSQDDSGGRTGRTSCKEPAYQTIPKHTIWAKPLRSVYVPPPGHVILDIDFSQGELRITACIANESTMIQGYKDGVDMHLKTGATLNGLELEEAVAMKMANNPVVKTIRQGGKAGNFGLIYGMGADGFQDYAQKTYGLYLTMPEVHNFIGAFFDLYDGLRPWHAETIARARKQGYIESPLGRVRHLPLIKSFMQDIRAKQERVSINTGVQATLTDMGLLAMAELDRAYPDLWLFGFTHDSLSFYVPEDEYMEWAIRIKQVMENLPFAQFGWTPQLGFPVEVEYGLNNLSETVKLPLTA